MQQALVHTVGAFALPGLAEAIAVRPAADSGESPDAYTQGFILPESAASPGALVLPVGWYHPSRQIEMRIGEVAVPVRLALIEHLRRGYDYDLATFRRIG